jgi:hypothetical protein
MTSKEFIFWLKGFVAASNNYNLTPAAWQELKDNLSKVDDNTIPMGGVIVDHNTFRVNDQGFYQNPNGTTNTPSILTTTPGVSSITFATPPFTTTSTAYGYSSGSSVNYTNSTYNPPYTTCGTDEVVKPQDTEVSNEKTE